MEAVFSQLLVMSLSQISVLAKPKLLDQMREELRVLHYAPVNREVVCGLGGEVFAVS